MLQKAVRVLAILMVAVMWHVGAQAAGSDNTVRVGALEARGDFEIRREAAPAEYTRSGRHKTITLDKLERSGELRQQALSRHGVISGVPLSAGIGRAVNATRNQKLFGQLLDWETMHDGSSLAAISFVSPAAVGNRLILRILSVDPKAVFVFRDGHDQIIHQVTGLEVLDAVTAGGKQDRLFAGPYIDGETSTLEVLLPAGVGPDTVRLAVPALSHIFISPHDEELNSKVGESSSCQIDVACKPEWNDVSRGIAKMLYSDTRDGYSYICTGNLMNDTFNSATPYFLTANHCISTQADASTLQTFWFYKSTSCNSQDASSSLKVRYGGATLLYTSRDTDTTLLKLNDAPPAGVQYLGWSTSLPAYGTSVGSVHHPSGDMQKISTGGIYGFSDCQVVSDAGDFYCFDSSAISSNHMQVKWSSGVTEAGSSGAGLFQSINGSQYLVGQLHGGLSSCAAPSRTDYYGSFGVAFEDGISMWLDPDPADVPRNPVYRFYNVNSSSHFFTSDAGERNFVIANYPSYVYEGIAFYAYKKALPDLDSVYRFYNFNTGAHFYTINQAERDYVIASFDSYAYEGDAWYASSGDTENATPLYRFYNTRTATHFYTADPRERDYVIATFPSYVYEGIGYYAWLTE